MDLAARGGREGKKKEEEKCLHLWPLTVTMLPNGARRTPHRSGRHTVPLDEPCQDSGEVTESLLPSCCLARGAEREANVVLFLGKALITGGVICDEHFGVFFLNFSCSFSF